MADSLTGTATIDNLFLGEAQIIKKNGVVIVDGEVVTRGSVLGLVTVAAGTAVPYASNTGDGTVSAFALAAGGPAKVGSYVATCIEAVANSGKFNIVDPDGLLVGRLEAVGTFTGGGITFAVADGTNDWVVGDYITFPVAAGSGNAMVLDIAATDGSQEPYAVSLTADSPSGATGSCAVALSGSFNSAVLNFAGSTVFGDVSDKMRQLNMYIDTAVASVTGDL